MDLQAAFDFCRSVDFALPSWAVVTLLRDYVVAARMLIAVPVLLVGQALMESREKWILHREGREAEFLSAPEISSLTDLASSYENVEKMKPFPLDKGSLVALVLAVAIPVLPTIVAEVPLKVVLKSLLEAMR